MAESADISSKQKQQFTAMVNTLLAQQNKFDHYHNQLTKTSEV